MQRLVHRRLGVEGKARIHLSRDLAGDDVEDLLAELHQQVVQRGVDLLVGGAAVALAVLDGGIDQLCILGLLGRSEDERGVGRRILRLVLVDGREVTGVADDGLAAAGRSASIHTEGSTVRRRLSPGSPRGRAGLAGYSRCQRPSIDRARKSWCLCCLQGNAEGNCTRGSGGR